MSLSLLTGMPYTPSDRTDIRETWARFGWTQDKKQPVKAPLRNCEKDYETVQSQDWLDKGFKNA